MSANEYNYSKLKSYGKSCFISSNVEIRRPHLVDIGSFVAIDSGFYLTTSAKLGNYIHIAPYVSCIGGVTALLEMQDFSTIAAGARLVCYGDEHLGYGLVGPTVPKEFADRMVGGAIVVQRYASIGTGAIVLPGLTIAEGSVLGAGAVLTKNTEPWTIYVGSPAKPIRVRPHTKMINFGQLLLEKLEESQLE